MLFIISTTKRVPSQLPKHLLKKSEATRRRLSQQAPVEIRQSFERCPCRADPLGDMNGIVPNTTVTVVGDCLYYTQDLDVHDLNYVDQLTCYPRR